MKVTTPAIALPAILGYRTTVSDVDGKPVDVGFYADATGTVKIARFIDGKLAIPKA